ncbi:MAG: hypothetical protein JNL67_19615 [Planctomycetaceae bacterium]|nr:hypothetical protein [Planctomycetaceae bacterium]
MSLFFPVYNRASDSLNHARLTASLQANQARLHELQQQIATGRRITRLSQDPSSGIRAMGYQASIEHTTQYARNLQANQSFLAATDTQLRNGNNILTQLRGEIVTWSSGTLNEADRQSAIQKLHSYKDQLLAITNTQYQGRYLFAGADTQQQPFVTQEGQIFFRGNDGQLKVPTTADILVQNNISAQVAFGGQSRVVQGVPNLQSQLTAETRLSDLHLGSGVQLGSLQVSDGYQSSVIDLTSAETIGDVIRLMETNPPGNRHLKVEIKGDRLEVRFSDAGPDLLVVQEANGGNIASDLGIRTGLAQTEAKHIVGISLRPQITATTPLSRLSGTPAVAYLASPGDNNDIVLRSRQVGSAENGLRIQYVDSSLLQAGPGVIQGSEEVFVETNPRAARAGLAFSGTGNDLQLTASQPGSQLNQVEIEIYSAGAIGDSALVTFNPSDKRLRIGIDSGDLTSAQAIINAINAEGTFTAAGDASDPSNGAFNPAATISTADVGVTTGNTGNSGGDANTVFIHVHPELSNGYHVYEAIKKNAVLNERFEIELDPTDGPVKGTPGRAIIDATATAITSGGSGEIIDLSSGFEITVGQVTKHVSLTGAETVEDLINAVQATNLGAYAQINEQRNGLVLGIRQAGVTFSIGESGGTTATQLGLRTMSRDTQLSDLNFGRGVSSQPGTDFTITRRDGTSFAVDVSSTKTIGDVLDRINNHPDNQSLANQVIARLATTGNGIEITQDNPTGSGLLSVRRQFGSRAAQDLGLVPLGQDVGYPSASNASAASLEVLYPDLSGQHRSFSVRANVPGDQYNNVEVEIVSGATGDNAVATYNGTLGRITVQVDPGATRTSTLVAAINQTGIFRAQLVTNPDGSHNNGLGLVSQLGAVGVLSGGSAQPSAVASNAVVRPVAPNQLNTALTITAEQPGTGMDGYAIVFQTGAVGDVATASVNTSLRQLVVTIDPSATTAATIRDAINTEGTFSAALNTDVDPSNNGSGVFAQVGTLGVTTGGAPEVLRGADINRQENHNIFNTIERMIAALGAPNAAGSIELQHSAKLLEIDIDRLSQAMAEVGSRHQYNDFLVEQNETLLIDLKGNLSQEVEVDMVEAVSKLTAQQATVEASLKMIAQTFRVSLLDYI